LNINININIYTNIKQYNITIKYQTTNNKQQTSKMLHGLDIKFNNATINNEPAILKYWIEGKISPSIKEKNIKIIINEDRKKDKK
jgi:hypothetical protein